MDSKIVSARLRSEIRPYLKEAGFSAFTGRNAWRRLSDRTEVVSYISFNSYNASVIGCTTYSFFVNLGVYFHYIPNHLGRSLFDADNPKFRPPEHNCHFRGGLSRSFAQPELERRDIWYIDEGGSYLDKAVHDTRMALARDGMPWFERFSRSDEVLRTLLEDEEDMQALWGFGRNPSPIRHYMTGYVSHHLGRDGVAEQHLKKAIESGCFNGVANELETDLAAISQ
jgi:hypothetical protein